MLLERLDLKIPSWMMPMLPAHNDAGYECDYN